MTLPADDVETIVAVATPPGRGGLAIVRASGPAARSVLAAVLRLRHPLAAGRARFGELIDQATGGTLDQVVATWFAAPHSYTGEDVVEVALHGTPVLAEYVLRAALGHGARLAEPGEFTRRALLAGRLDLTQAEAVHDLVASTTLEQARVAAAQLGGAVSRQVAPAKEELIDLIAELEAGIDFAEDDLMLLPREEVARRLRGIRGPLGALAESFSFGRRLREGVSLAIVGRPNAGKSSLFNRLLAQERAIVTAEPGTTRDVVTERLAIGGVPVELVDTAGLRDTPADAAEREGIRRSRMAMADADLVLLVVDATCGMSADDEKLLQELKGRPHLVVVNKCDLLTADAADERVFTSAITGHGIKRLRKELEGIILGSEARELPEQGVLTNLRQHAAVMAAIGAVDDALSALVHAVPDEFLLLDLQRGLTALDSLTGVTSDDEVLGRIFSRFCIGK